MNLSDIQLTNINLMYIILSLILIIFFFFLRSIHNDKTNPYTFMDLVVSDKKIQERKVTRLGTWIVSTWGFVYLLMQGQLHEWYFVGYIGAWVANAIFAKGNNNNTTKEEDYDR